MTKTLTLKMMITMTKQRCKSNYQCNTADGVLDDNSENDYDNQYNNEDDATDDRDPMSLTMTMIDDCNDKDEN